MYWITRHGFELKERLHHGRYTAVLRCVKRADGTPFVIKAAETSYSGDLGAARVRHEHRILTRLARHGVQHLLPMPELISNADVTALVWPDQGARAFLTNGTLSLGEAVQVATLVAECLIKVHNAGIIHKDINPNNILVAPDGGVALIDFDIASEIALELQTGKPRLEGTLLYVSPEQTGRINRLLDYRTDLYGLGATLYHVLTGSPLFDVSTPVELVHAIVTRQPTDVRSLNPAVPAFLAGVVHKLIAKDPDARYQSAYGVREDLLVCAALLRGDSVDVNLRPGCRDRSERFLVSQRLHGREREIVQLREALSRVRRGAAEWVFLSGPSGIGKSTLVQELRADLAGDGFFASGKYDPLRRHVPLSALSQAMAEVVHDILREDSASVETWREHLQAAVGSVGQALVSHVPSLALLLGAQRPVADLPTRENENRLVHLWQRFLTALAASRPLVLVLDDMQWVDTATVRLLGQIATAPTGQAQLLLVLGYRSDEVRPGHLLAGLFDLLEAAPVTTQHVCLSALNAGDVASLLVDSTHAAPDTVRPLAALLHQKTAGNPFFVRQFLQHMADKALLRYDVEAGAWCWNLEHVRRLVVTDNVVALLTERLRQLPDSLRNHLGAAACIGNKFSLDLLCTCTDASHANLAYELTQAAAEGIIVPLDETYRYAEHMHADVHYRFVHDQVQQAAHAQLTAEVAMGYHERLGKALQARGLHDASSIFAAADHLNRAAARLDTAGRANLVRLNLDAQAEARRAAAQAAAEQYAAAAVSLLPEDAWQVDRALARRATLALADSQFASGQSDAAVQNLDTCLRHAQTPLEQAEVLHRWAAAMTAQGRQRDAITAAQNGLRLLGVRLGRNRLVALRRMLELKMLLARRDAQSLAAAPEITEPRWLVVLELLDSVALAAFIADPPLWQVCALEIGLITLRRGNSKFTAATYSRLAALFARNNDYATALHLSEACASMEARGEQLSRAATAHRRLAHVEHVALPVTQLCHELAEASHLGLETGDSLYVGWNVAAMIERGLSSSLGQATETVRRYQDFAAHRASEQQRHAHEGLALLCQYLIGKVEALPSDPAWAVPPTQGPVPVEVGMYLASKMAILLNHGDLAAAEAIANRPRLFAVMADGSVHLAALYAALTLTQAAAGRAARPLPAAFKIYQAKVTAAALNGAGVLAGGAILISAELAALRHRWGTAQALYQEAAERLEQSGYLRLAGMAHECAARTYLRRGLHLAAHGHLHAARRAYNAWGGGIKVQLLEREFSALVGPRTARRGSVAQTADGTLTTTSTITPSETSELAHGNILDVDVVLRVSNAMSSEVVLDKLVVKILLGIMQSAGASRGLLTLKQDDGLILHADSAWSEPHDPEPLSAMLAPLQVIQYVARIGETLLEADLSKSRQWDDAYKYFPRPKSMLCLPIRQHGTVRGVVYLENDANTHVFTASRLQLLEVLSTQAAISLENALLYGQLEAMVKQRTEQLRLAQADLVRTTRENAETQMAGGFAHEMRNVLSAARMMLDTAIQTTSVPAAPGPLDEVGLREILVDVADATDRALRITRQILEYSQVGGLVREHAAADVGAVLAKIIKTLDPELRQSRVQISTDLVPHAVAAAKEEHVYSILDNLVRNAREALSELADDRQRTIYVRSSVHDQQVVVEVQDTGPGISESLAKRLFQPFVSTKGSRGTGLGLGMARRLAELYGGSVQFSSEGGRGATFSVRLPTARVEGAP